MSSTRSLLRCNATVKPAHGLVQLLLILLVLLAGIVFQASRDIFLTVSFLLAAMAAVDSLRQRLLLQQPAAIRRIRFSESRGWQLELVNGERITVRLVGEPRAFRNLCALDFVDSSGRRFAWLAGWFNCSDADLHALNVLLHWSSQTDLFSAERDSLRP